MESHALGSILPEAPERDAIHVAIIPVQARTELNPGQPVGKDGTDKDPIGVVDPFLDKPVKAGQIFWMLLKPRTITGLRHHWEHPDYPNPTSPIEIPRAAAHKNSLMWLQNFAKEVGCTFDKLMDATKDWLDNSNYFVQGGKFEGVTIPDEFWTHYSRLTNDYIHTSKQRSFFSCSC